MLKFPAKNKAKLICFKHKESGLYLRLRSVHNRATGIRTYGYALVERNGNASYLRVSDFKLLEKYGVKLSEFEAITDIESAWA